MTKKTQLSGSVEKCVDDSQQVPSARPMPLSGRVAGGDAQTRAHLIDVAIRLFARYGIEAISMRQIIAESGRANQSAIQYYFGGKDGLIVAAIDALMEEIKSMCDATESELAKKGELLGLDELVSAYLKPLMIRHISSPELRRMVQFADRLTRSDPEYYDWLIRKLQPYQDALIRRIQSAVPQQNPEVTAVKSFYVLGTILHSLADTRLSVNSPSPMSRFTQLELVDIFVDFIVGAIMGGGVTSTKPGSDQTY